MKKYKNEKVGPIKAYQLFWQNYLKFKSVSSRSEYWWAFLWNWLIRIILALVAVIGFLKVGTQGAEFKIGVGALIVYSLAALIPSLSLNFRRYQDAGLSGWWIVGTYGLPIILRLILIHYPPKSLINDFCGLVIFILLVVIILIPMIPSKPSHKGKA